MPQNRRTMKDNSKYFPFVLSAQHFENYVYKLTHCQENEKALILKKKNAQTQGKY
jgi:hypothetical protein